MVRQQSVVPAGHAQYTSCLLVYYFPNDSLCACFPYFIDWILWILMFAFMVAALTPLPLCSFIGCYARLLSDIFLPVFSESMQHFLESSVKLSLNFFFTSFNFQFGNLDHFIAKFSRLWLNFLIMISCAGFPCPFPKISHSSSPGKNSSFLLLLFTPFPFRTFISPILVFFMQRVI